VDYRGVLAPGERASLPISSATIWQSKKAFQYLVGIFTEVPALAKLVTNITADTISLSTRVDIECRPASFRSIRGGTCCACIADEVAFWRSDESANPDYEVLAAVRPSLATMDGPLICISSPYSRRGELFNAWKNHFGEKGDPAIIVAKAGSRAMNSTLPQKIIDRAFARDPSAAASEYGRDDVDFRSDIEAFISPEVVEAVTISGRFELPPVYGTNYIAFVDPSGGRGDDMTMAIAHREGDMAILDCIRCAKPPFAPQAVVAEFVATLKRYDIFKVTGDRYGGEWPVAEFAKHGITYDPSERTKSEIYQQCLPLLMGRRVELLDHEKLQNQLVGLERKTSRAGKDSIDHAPLAHDDVCNAVCGALALAIGWEGDFDILVWMKAWAKSGTPAWREVQRLEGERTRKARELAELNDLITNQKKDEIK
jgi:hypothetical protein